MRIIHWSNSTISHWPLMGLALLMAATRFHHEGTSFALPDASLAVFFLVGWYSSQRIHLLGFLIGAAFIDYVAIALMGVSDYCVTPAYAFLIPTYGTLWIGGRWMAQGHRRGRALPWTRFVLALPGVSTLAFLLSNGSFFLLSGRFDNIDFTLYVQELLREYPPYTLSTLFYATSALLLGELFKVRVGGAWRMQQK